MSQLIYNQQSLLIVFICTYLQFFCFFIFTVLHLQTSNEVLQKTIREEKDIKTRLAAEVQFLMEQIHKMKVERAKAISEVSEKVRPSYIILLRPFRVCNRLQGIICPSLGSEFRRHSQPRIATYFPNTNTKKSKKKIIFFLLFF